jgi:hypothetical protein
MASVRSGQYDQNRLNIDNSDRLIAVMEDVVMRTGRSENILSQMFGHLGYIRRKLQKGVSVEKDSSVVERDPSFVGPIRPDPVATGDSLEERREQQQWQNDLLDAIRNLSDNPPKEDKDPKKESSGLLRLGKLASAAAITIGALTGSIASLFKPLAWLTSKLTPKTLKSFMGKIGYTIKAVFVEGGRAIKNAVGNFASKLKTLFTENKIAKLLVSISEKFKSFTKPLDTLKDTLSFTKGGKGGSIFKRIGAAFTKIFSLFGSFGRTIATVFKIASRVFAPLVAAFIAGKNILNDIKTGDLGFGTIARIIDDLIKFFVIDMLDMVKGAFGWISGKLGFEGIQEFLSSFSFGDLYLLLKEKLFGVIESIGTYASDIFGDLIGGFKKLISGDFIEGIVGIFTAINKPFKDLKKWLGNIVLRVLETLTPKNLALLAAGSENAKGFDYILKGEAAAQVDAVKPMTGSELDKAVKENNKTSDNPIIIQDNSNNSTNTSGGGGGETHVHTGVTSTDGADPNILAFGR